MNPKVSFIIAAYNEEKYIQNCIDSCLEQTYDNIEVCVTDDGSQDRTWKLLENYSSDQVKIDRFSKNKGKVIAFNNSFSLATGKYIAIIGADDVNLPNRVENQLKFLIDQAIDLTWGKLIHIGSSGEILKNYYTPLKVKPKKCDILQDNFIPGNTIFLSKRLANQIFPIPKELKFEDWWIAFNAIFSAKYKMLETPVIKYRIHENNTVGNTSIDYVQLRRKNIRRHITYHEIFDKKLLNNTNFQRINHLVKNYKLACLEDHFKKRLTLFFRSLPFFRLKSLKVILKFLFITFFGLKGVQTVFK